LIQIVLLDLQITLHVVFIVIWKQMNCYNFKVGISSDFLRTRRLQYRLKFSVLFRKSSICVFNFFFLSQCIFSKNKSCFLVLFNFYCDRNIFYR